MTKKEKIDFLKFMFRFIIWVVIYMSLSVHFYNINRGFISDIFLFIAIFAFFSYTITRGA